MLRRTLLSAATVLTLAAAGAISPGMAQIRIAAVGPMTGEYASFGQQMKSGAEQAIADINKAGGIMGQQLVLEVGDDACDPKQANAVAGKLASQGPRQAISRLPGPS